VTIVPSLPAGGTPSGRDLSSVGPGTTATSIIRSVPSVPAAESCAAVRELLKERPEWPALAVTDGGTPVGLVNRTQFLTRMAKPFMEELFDRKPVTRLMDPAPPMVDADLPLPLVLEASFTNTGDQVPEAFVVTRRGAYLGLATGMDFLHALNRITAAETKRVMEREQRLRDIAETSTGWLWERDAAGRYTYVSPRFEKITGIPESEMIGLLPQELDRIGLVVDGTELLEEKVAARKPYHDLTYRVRFRDGRELYWSGSGKPVSDPTGAFAGYRGTTSDVTDRYLRERATRERNEVLRRIAAHVPGVVFQLKIDADGTQSFTFISESVFDIYAVTADEVYADAMARLRHVHPADRALMRASIAESREKLVPWSCVYRVERDGRTIWMQGKAVPERHPDGSTVWDGVSIDITPIKEGERQLQQALATATAADAAKRDFLAVMSHELRTPLNAVIGFADIMRSEMFGPLGHDSYREYVDDIANSGQHLLQLINDILDFSSLEADRMVLSDEEVLLDQLIEECQTMLRPRADAKRIDFRVVFGDEALTAYIDRRRTLQVLLNLATNAIKFTPDHGTVRIGASVTAAGEIEIRVDDTGVGISEADQAHLFEPFWQADSRLARVQQEGTGLGLSLTKRLVEQHGGTIEVRSRIGHGTSVIVTLPPDRLARRAPRPYAAGSDVEASAA